MGLFGKDAPPLKLETASLHVEAKCCGRSDFIVGALTFSVRHDPASGFYERTESGCIVACTHCGRKLAINSAGTYSPHDDALPGPWALERVRQREGDPKPVPGRPRVAMRRPPRDE